MAVIHISREEAARDFDRLFSRASAGDEVIVEDGNATVTVTRSGGVDLTKPRLLSEVLEGLRKRNNTATLDEDFGRDLEEIIASHREPSDPPAWD